MKYWILVGQTPIETNVNEWSRWFEMNDRTVASSIVSAHGRQYKISTVFIGIEYIAGYSDVPDLFETMVFSGEGDPWDNYQLRWRSYLEAKRGHLMIEIQVGSNRKP